MWPTIYSITNKHNIGLVTDFTANKAKRHILYDKITNSLFLCFQVFWVFKYSTLPMFWLQNSFPLYFTTARQFSYMILLQSMLILVFTSMLIFYYSKWCIIHLMSKNVFWANLINSNLCKSKINHKIVKQKLVLVVYYI